MIHSALFRTALVLPVLALSLPALAAGPYVGGNYSRMEFDDPERDTDDPVTPDAVTLRLGAEANDVVGLEARGGVGFDSATRDGVEYELDHLYGAYLKLSAPLEQARPYIIGGYSRVRATARVDFGLLSGSETETREGESWGAGVDLGLTDNVALNLEYMRYLDKDDLEVSGIALGLRSAF